MNRILIIGSPGAGKSTFAKELAWTININDERVDFFHVINVWLVVWNDRLPPEPAVLIK